MPKIDRKTFKPFGKGASLDQIAQVGSLRAGAPTFSKDPEVIQGLANYEDGWFAIAMGENSPAMEDMNGIQYVFAYMISMILQSGIAEWDDGTEYVKDSIVRVGAKVYLSLQDANTNKNPATQTAYWVTFGNKITYITEDYTVVGDEQIVILGDTAETSVTITVDPALLTNGQKMKFINQDQFPTIAMDVDDGTTLYRVLPRGQMTLIKTTIGTFAIDVVNPAQIQKKYISAASAVFADGTKLIDSVVIHTTGRPVRISLDGVPDDIPGQDPGQITVTKNTAPSAGNFRVTRLKTGDALEVIVGSCRIAGAVTSMTVPPGSVNFTDYPQEAAEYTYKLYAWVEVSGQTLAMFKCNLIAAEGT